MPRTVFGPGLSFPKDAEGLRRSAELQHHRQQEKSFLFPLSISLDEAAGQGSTDAVWKWQHHYYMNRDYEKKRDELTAEEHRRFCFKDCAIYGVSETNTSHAIRRQLFDRIYRRWFPTRAEDVDISHGSFFAHWIELDGRQRSAAPRASFAEALALHKDLCLRVKQAIPEMGLPTPFTAAPWEATEEHSLLSPRAEYKLRPSFEHCFIYLHAEQSDHSMDSSAMRDRGVRVVFVTKAYAAEHGCLGAAQQGVTCLVEEGQELDGAAVFRCDTIEIAMSVVLGMNLERNGRRQEKHGYYQDEALDSSAGDARATEPCLCSKCVEAERRHGD